MHHANESVTWAYDDMDAARRLWPRIKTLIENQVASGDLALSLGDQRRVISAVVSDLLEQEKREAQARWCAPKSIGKLLRRFRKSGAPAPHGSSLGSLAENFPRARDQFASLAGPLGESSFIEELEQLDSQVSPQT